MNELDLTLTDMCTPDVEWHWPPSTSGGLSGSPMFGATFPE